MIRWFGSAVGRRIGLEYREKHPGDRVFVDEGLGTIADELGGNRGSLGNARQRPDVFNGGNKAVPDGSLYEIKPEGAEEVAAKEAQDYVVQLTNAGVPAHLGDPEAPGTSGKMTVWGLSVEWESPAPGVITYGTSNPNNFSPLGILAVLGVSKAVAASWGIGIIEDAAF